MIRAPYALQTVDAGLICTPSQANEAKPISPQSATRNDEHVGRVATLNSHSNPDVTCCRPANVRLAELGAMMCEWMRRDEVAAAVLLVVLGTAHRRHPQPPPRASPRRQVPLSFPSNTLLLRPSASPLQQ